MKVVGEAEVLDVIEDYPNDVWEIASEYAGVSKVFFDHLGNVKKYAHPSMLSDYGVKVAPQSFVYV